MFTGYSYLAIDRVNLLIKLLNDCMDQPTNAMLGSKLPSVTEGVNMHVWHLRGSESTTVVEETKFSTGRRELVDYLVNRRGKEKQEKWTKGGLDVILSVEGKS